MIISSPVLFVVFSIISTIVLLFTSADSFSTTTTLTSASPLPSSSSNRIIPGGRKSEEQSLLAAAKQTIIGAADHQNSNTKSKNKKKNSNNNNNNNNNNQKDMDSWSFPGSSESWWSYSSSSGAPSSQTGDSSSYQTGSSFYKEPQFWHEAGNMKYPFAHSCATFTRRGNIRFFGGYRSEPLHPPTTATTTTTVSPPPSPTTTTTVNSSSSASIELSTNTDSTAAVAENNNNNNNINEEHITLLSRGIYDLSFPVTELVQNVSLPQPLENITGPTSCSMNMDFGITYVMAGNTKRFSSSAVYSFSDNLELIVDLSLPFEINRSSIAATVVFETSSSSSVSDNSFYLESHNRVLEQLTFIPDAVVIGGEGNLGMWGLHASTGNWTKVCEFSVPLCDCAVISHTYENFVLACNNCTHPQVSVWMTNFSCYLWDSQAPSYITDASGLQYIQGLEIGKFSTYLHRAVDSSSAPFISLFDHGLEQWIVVEPLFMDPPRSHGGVFSWKGKLQFAGGEKLSIFENNNNSKNDNVANEENNNNNNKQQIIEPFYTAAASSPEKSKDEEGKKTKLVLHAATTDIGGGDMVISPQIEDIPILNFDNLVSFASKHKFYKGDYLTLECPGNFYLMIASAPNCLRPISKIVHCSSESNFATLELDTLMSEGYICASPGTCRYRNISDRIPCSQSDPANNNFAQCSGGFGCCWDAERKQCFQHADLSHDGGYPYFYTIDPHPITVELYPTPAPPTPTTATTGPGGSTVAPASPSPGESTPSPAGPGTKSPSSNNNNGNSNGANEDAFLDTTTGKVVVFGASGVVVLTIAVAFFLHCTKKTKEGNSSFCLHEFVSKRYEIMRELGRGGFGTVYLAVRRADKKELALKVIACNNDDDVQSALQEFQLLRDIKPHPSMMRIVDIHCSWDDDNDKKNTTKKRISRPSTLMGNNNNNNNSQSRILSGDNLHSPPRSPSKGNDEDDDAMNNNNMTPSTAPNEPLLSKSGSRSDLNGEGTKIEQQSYVCIVMEFYDEGDLAHFVYKTFQQGGGPSEAWLWTVLARQLFGVLAHLHAQEPHPIVHRDIKPENILLGSGGNRIIITDFGLAAQHHRTFMSTRAGSFHYLAPECWSHRYTASVDVWSAGCILYATATGCVAPPAARVMFNDARHPSFGNEIRDDLRGYSPDFANLVLSILKMDPNQRPTAQQVYETVAKKCALLVKNGSDEDTSSAVGSSIHLSVSEKSTLSVQ